MSRDADVAVVGVGSIGSMALWRLAARGASVVGYERFGVGHHRGAAGGQTRRFAALSQRDPRTTPLALDAIRMWRALEQESGAELLHLVGGIILGPENTPAVVNARRSAVDNDVAHEYLLADQLRSRFPQHLVRDDDVGVVDELSGYLRPEASVVSAVRAARARGAQVEDYTTVIGIEPDGDDVVVRTSSGTRRFGTVVVAPGAWAPSVVPVVGGAVVPRRLIQAWYVPDDLSDYLPDRFPVFERVGDVRAYGFPSVDGATIKVAVYTQEHPVIDDLELPDPRVEPEAVRLLRDQIATFLHGIHHDPVTVSLHREGYTADGAPLVGEVPGMPGVVSACGFSGSGFKFAPAMGDVVADLVLDGGSARDVAHLNPGRLAEPAPQRG